MSKPWYKPASQVMEEKLESQKRSVRSEAKRRITGVWPEWAQVNAVRGAYGEEAKASMESWVDDHRTVVDALLARDDLVDLDVTDDQWWPSPPDRVEPEPV